MKRNFLISFGISASLLALPLLTLAAVVTLDQNLTLVLPSDSSSLTLDSGGTFNALSVSGSSFSLTLDPGDSVTIHDGSKRNLTNSRSIDTFCAASESKITHSLSSSAGSGITITTTPSGTCATSTAVASSGGGGGGGGGGGSAQTYGISPSPSPTPSTTVSPNPTPSVSASPITMSYAPAFALNALTIPSQTGTSIVPSFPPIVITRTLVLGLRGSDVTSLQTFLARDPSIYPEGVVSGYFGAKTLAAIKRFQEKYGLAVNGRQGYGVVGPKTRAKIKELSVLTLGSPALASAPSASPTVATLMEQIKILQEMINKLQQR